MYTQKKKCVDPILELLGLGHLYHGKHPLVWIPDLYPKDNETLKQPTITEHAKPSNPDSNCVREKIAPYGVGHKSNEPKVNEEVDLSQYFVEAGEEGPYASLLTDITFKKAFSPDTEQGKVNLLNLLNDMLKGQIKHRITDVISQQSELNNSGSKESKTSIFDLHCRDERNEQIDVEVQIRKKKNFLKRLVFYSSQMIVQQGLPGHKWNYNVKPSFIIAITKHKIFKKDNLPIHRAGIWDYTTGKQLVDCMNFTIVELPKIKKKINNRDSEVAKWMFALRYLNNLKGLPPALNMGKFKGLLEFAKISRFSKEELERYRYAMHMEWDDYAEEEAFIEDHPKFIKKIEKRLLGAIKQKMQKNNLSKDVIKKCLSLTTPNGQPH